MDVKQSMKSQLNICSFILSASNVAATVMSFTKSDVSCKPEHLYVVNAKADQL